MDFLPLNAFGIFLAIAGVGFLFLLITLIFGELFDFFEFDHDFEHGGPGLFSSRVIAVFITAFGCFGAIGTQYGMSPMAASGLGAASGLFFGGIIFVFARFLYSQQASSDVRPADLVGQQGRVVVGIPAGGIGQVRCRIGEELVDKIARSNDGGPVPENTLVVIDEMLGETVVVRRS
jgi:membrane protein implicated in regulation of membrane protease activity